MQQAARQLIFYGTKHHAVGNCLRMFSMHGFLPSAVWQRIPVERGFQVRLPSGSTFRYQSVRADRIGRFLYWRGFQAWESETVGVFSALAAQSAHILDVGANTGAFTLIACASNPRAQIISVEPVPFIADRLRSNIALNGWEDRCVVVEAAVAERSGVAQFHVPDEGLPTSSSLKDTGFRGAQGKLITVPLRAVDDLTQHWPGVDLVKIDVEGFEDKALCGMQRVLSVSRPAVVCECNVDGPFASVERIMRTSGYAMYHLRDRGPEPVETIAPDPHERWRNFLFIHPSSRIQLSPTL